MELAELASYGEPYIHGSAATPGELANLLDIAFGGLQADYFDLVRGDVGSARILTPYPLRGSVRLPMGDEPASGYVAREMMRLIEFGCRHPPEPEGRCRKGWEVQSVTIHGNNATVLKAAWVPYLL